MAMFICEGAIADLVIRLADVCLYFLISILETTTSVMGFNVGNIYL